MTELKECPFCGSDGDVYNANCRTPDADGTKQINWVVDCSVCNFGNEFEDSEEEAIKAWNERPTEDNLKADNKLLRDDLGEVQKLVTSLEKNLKDNGIKVSQALLIIDIKKALKQSSMEV